MNLNICFLFLNVFFVNSSQIIKNNHLPACKNCIYYKPSYLNNFSSTYSKCEKFGEKNIITNEITYNYADSCRRDESKCGEVGTYFENDKNVKLKIFRHYFINNIQYFFPFICIIISRII